jgi:hypothetical protein
VSLASGARTGFAVRPGTSGGGGGPGSSTFNTYAVNPSLGQTAFILPIPYLAGGLVIVAINGIVYVEGTNYTIVGTTLTWLDTPFTLDSADTLWAEYQTS